MQEVEVVIDESGLTCTTVNPLGERPENVFSDNPNWKYSKQYLNSDSYIKWQQAESERKTYEIKNHVSMLSDPPQHFYKPGSIHQARIENGKATIL